MKRTRAMRNNGDNGSNGNNSINYNDNDNFIFWPNPRLKNKGNKRLHYQRSLGDPRDTPSYSSGRTDHKALPKNPDPNQLKQIEKQFHQKHTALVDQQNEKKSPFYLSWLLNNPQADEFARKFNKHKLHTNMGGASRKKPKTRKNRKKRKTRKRKQKN